MIDACLKVFRQALFLDLGLRNEGDKLAVEHGNQFVLGKHLYCQGNFSFACGLEFFAHSLPFFRCGRSGFYGKAV